MGKGSVSSLLSCVLQAHGRRVGLFTSPHLIDVTERFRVNGGPLPQSAVLQAGTHVIKEYGGGDGVPKPEITLTYFELCTLMATHLFKDSSVDVAIYEVGLGGRLDATNCLGADLSCCAITTIGFDHMNVLGNTIGAIAAEKAGIMRQGRPVVIGHQEYPEAGPFLEAEAKRYGALPRVCHKDFDVNEPRELHPCKAWVRLSSGAEAEVELPPDLGPYARNHAGTALQTAAEYLKDDFDPTKAATGLRAHRWPGRFDRRSVPVGDQELDVVFDGAHNVDGMRALVGACKRSGIQTFDTVVFSAVADKEAEGMYSLLMTVISPGTQVIGVVLNNPRRRSAERLQQELTAAGATAVTTCSAAEAAKRLQGRTLVCGSLYLIGEMMEELGVDAGSIYMETENSGAH